MPHWLQLMMDSLPTLLWAGVKFTIPLTLLSFFFGLILGLATAVARLFGPTPLRLLARFYYLNYGKNAARMACFYWRQ